MADCLARASRFGVSPRVEPRKPMRSARVVSSVIRMMLGGFGWEDGALEFEAGTLGGAANALAIKPATNNSPRITTIASWKPLFASNTLIIQILYLSRLLATW